MPRRGISGLLVAYIRSALPGGMGLRVFIYRRRLTNALRFMRADLLSAAREGHQDVVDVCRTLKRLDIPEERRALHARLLELSEADREVGLRTDRDTVVRFAKRVQLRQSILTELPVNGGSSREQRYVAQVDRLFSRLEQRRARRGRDAERLAERTRSRLARLHPPLRDVDTHAALVEQIVDWFAARLRARRALAAGDALAVEQALNEAEAIREVMTSTLHLLWPADGDQG